MAKKKVVKRSESRKERTGLDKYLTLDWKEFYLLFISWFLFIALHFLITVIFGIPDNVLPVIYKFIIPLFVVIALIYTLLKRHRKKY